MSNPFDQIRSELATAQAWFRAVDLVADRMAGLLVGRLRKVPTWTLVKLKRELRDFNAHTKEWRN